MKQKAIFQTIFLLLVILLAALPFLVAFNESLTKLVERFTLYTWLQRSLVPAEVRMVTTMLSFFSVKVTPYLNGFVVAGTFLEMTWNCLGWQSLLLLTLTLATGLRSGRYTLATVLEMIVIGILGTFLINLLRLTLIVLIFAYLRPLYAVVYHDYLAAIVTIVWLFFFWWFSYSFVLEEKVVDDRGYKSIDAK